MKNIYFFLFSSLLFTSCSTDSDQLSQQQAEEEFVTVGITLGGELTVTESPLKSGIQAATKAADTTGSTDLFGIQIYDAINDIPYAYVVGNEISQISFELKKDWEYDIEMTYIKDGKNKIKRNSENKWSFPLFASGEETPLNEIFYGTSNELNVSISLVSYKNSDDIEFVPVDRYYAIQKGYTTTESENEIELNLKRVVFGLSLQIDLGTRNNIDEVVFRFSETHHRTKYYINLKDGKGYLELPLITLGTSSDRAIEDDHEEDVRLLLGTEDQYYRFFSETLKVKRNTMHHITFTADINDGSEVESTMGNVKFSLEETEMDDLYVDFSEEE